MKTTIALKNYIQDYKNDLQGNQRQFIIDNLTTIERQQREIKNDLVAAWNEIEEAETSLTQLNDSEIIENKEAINKRLNKALNWLGKYITEEDIIETI